jgi:hypothetical protein
MLKASFGRDAAVTLTHGRGLRTQILSRNVVCVKRRFLPVAIVLLIGAACSRLPDVTTDILSENERRWKAHKPDSYRLVLEMSGDRVESGRYEVEVRRDTVVSLRHNGMVVRPNDGQDYSMEGLFHMVAQELSLAQKPAMLNAPPGYSVYTTARFDDESGRLIRYRRIVGGTSNAIEVNVLEFQAQ